MSSDDVSAESLINLYEISRHSAHEIVSTMKSIKKYKHIKKKMDMYHDCIVLFDDEGDITHLLLRQAKEVGEEKEIYELHLISPDTYNDDKGETIMWASTYDDIKSMAYDYLECLRIMNDNHSLEEMSLDIYKIDKDGKEEYVEEIYIELYESDY